MSACIRLGGGGWESLRKVMIGLLARFIFLDKIALHHLNSIGVTSTYRLLRDSAFWLKGVAIYDLYGLLCGPI